MKGACEKLVSAVVGGFLVLLGLLTIPLAVRDVYLRIKKQPSRFWQACRRKHYTLPATATDPKWGNHEFVAANGLNFHIVHKGDRRKPLLLCIHGFPECWYTWRYQLQHFSDRYFVVAVDMRGYGETQRPGGSYIHWRNYGVGEIARDVIELIKALGFQKATLMAHDWGGSIAWSVTDSYPEYVHQLIIFNAPNPKVFVNNMGWKQMLRSWYETLWDLSLNKPTCSAVLALFRYMLFNQLPLVPEMWFRFPGMDGIRYLFTVPPYGVNNKVRETWLELFLVLIYSFICLGIHERRRC